MGKENNKKPVGRSIKESRGRRIFNWFNVVFLGLFAFITFYPFWYVAIVSFNTGRDTLRGGMWVLPRAFTLENYIMALKDDRIFRSLGVSVFITVATITLGLILMSMVAYAMSVREFPGRTAFAFFWYFTTLFGGGMIPYYLLLKSLHLTTSIWLYIIPSLYGFSRFVMIRTYFQNIPYELRESAEMDGAGHMMTMWKIYMPLARPMLATQGLMIGVSKWNDWYAGMYYQAKEKLQPAATVLKVIMEEASAALLKAEESSATVTGEMVSYTSTSIQYAFVVLLTLPVLIAYPFLQKYFAKGMMVGSVKG